MNLKEATNKKGKDKTIVFVLDMILEKCGKRNGKAIKTKENSLSDFKIICIYIYICIYIVYVCINIKQQIKEEKPYFQ
jgi:hypothetical protein